MNKNDLKAEMDKLGIEYAEEATNKELTALLNAADTTNEPEAISESPFDIAAAAEIAAQVPAEAPKGISEEAIGEKTRFGLTRSQAIEILQSQAAHDAAEKAAEKGKG